MVAGHYIYVTQQHTHTPLRDQQQQQHTQKLGRKSKPVKQTKSKFNTDIGDTVEIAGLGQGNIECDDENNRLIIHFASFSLLCFKNRC
jgi:hypothetical protein